jgi:hypothetical protein
MSPKSIRFSHPPYRESDFITFTLDSPTGNVKCYGKSGEITKPILINPILGPWRDEIAASENWERAEKELRASFEDAEAK